MATASYSQSTTPSTLAASPSGQALNFSAPGSTARLGYQPGSYATPASPAYQTTTTTSQVVQDGVVAPCGTWSSFFECPLTIFTILAVLFFFFDIYNIWRGSQAIGGSSSTFWIVSIVSLLIYIAIAVAFGYWIKKKCAECKQGTAWVLFFVALFLPIILGLVTNVIIGAVGGGLSFLSGSLNKGGNGKKTRVPGGPIVTGPGQVPVVAPIPAQPTAAEALADALQNGSNNAAINDALRNLPLMA